MRYTLLAMLMMGCSATPSMGGDRRHRLGGAPFIISRVDETSFHVQQPDGLRWEITGAEGPDGPWEMGDGEIRLRRIIDTRGPSERTLLECASCAYTPNLRLPGATSGEWSGDGYGGESSPKHWRLLVDGVSPGLSVGEQAIGSRLDIEQVIVTWAPGEPVAPGSLRAPVSVREVTSTLTGEGWSWQSLVEVLSDHEISLVYGGRIEGPSVCVGGPWDGWEAEDGQTRDLDACPSCPGTSNRYFGWGGLPQRWTALTSSELGLSVRSEIPEPDIWLAIEYTCDGASQLGKVNARSRLFDWYWYPDTVTVMTGEVYEFRQDISIAIYP